MTDELLRPFRDKIRGRTPAPRTSEARPASTQDEVPADAVLIREVRLGLFPEASSLHPGFVPGIPRVRLTLDLGAHLRRRPVPIYPEGREALLDLCPRLLEHDCGAGDEIRLLLATDGTGSAGVPTAGPDGDERDGLHVAHLIEHVAIEMIVGVSGVPRCSGVTCAHRNRLDRFDIFLESVDPLAGRAAAVLATAVVRDLCLRRAGRLALHRRCRNLLAHLSCSGAVSVVAEDTAVNLGCGPEEALQVLEELVRLGYLTAAPSPYLFSSTAGVLFRRAAAELGDA
ncbi:MAG: hypothetical protein DMF52_03200 [Acidobacteria bacterium]|nr:MAG: hypothetical protein DMF52_03200 [Acidobacteriota bacterium]